MFSHDIGLLDKKLNASVVLHLFMSWFCCLQERDLCTLMPQAFQVSHSHIVCIMNHDLSGCYQQYRIAVEISAYHFLQVTR